MDEEIAIIDEKTRNEKIKSFFIKNKRLIISGLIILLLIVLSFYSYQAYNEGLKEKISDKYNNTVIEYKNGDKTKTIKLMKEIIEEEDSTYSPLALYFLIDNNLIKNQKEINDLFDILINKTSPDKPLTTLIIYKKPLLTPATLNENELIEILKPLINSDSVWKSHALYLIAEYFYSKNEKQKSKEFFNQIINSKNVNQDIFKEAQKRLNRDLSE